jgi:DNA-binding transcriptional LysR family regulator
MDLWQLHIFCKVVELQSFSKAGQTIHLSQPTISAHIKELEKHFDCLLIDRLPKVTPTAAGSLLYNYARQLLQLRDEAVMALAEFNGNYKGLMTIGGSTIPGNYLLPELIGAFKRDYRQVQIRLVIADTADIISRVVNGSIELGVVGALPSENHLDARRLVADKMRLIIPANHRWSSHLSISMDEFCREPFIAREPGSGTRAALEAALHLQALSVENLNVVAEMGSTVAVVQAIRARVGVSVLSLLAVHEAMQSGAVQALGINGLDLKRDFYLIRDSRRIASPIVKAFADYLCDNIEPPFVAPEPATG